MLAKTITSARTIAPGRLSSKKLKLCYMPQSLDARPDIVSQSTVIVSHPAMVLVCQVREKLFDSAGRVC